MRSCPGVRLPPSNGWDNRHLVPIRQHRLLASHKADIFIIEIEIHELPNRSPLIAQLFSEPGEMASQLIQHVLDRCPCDFDFTLLLGELLQGGRNAYHNGHVPSPSSRLAGFASVLSLCPLG